MKKTQERKLLKQKAQLKNISLKPKKDPKRNSLLDSSITQFQNWWRNLQEKVDDQRKFLKQRDVQDSQNKLLSLERAETRKIEIKQLKKAKIDEVRAFNAAHCIRKANIPAVPYKSKVRKKRPSQLYLPPGSDHANYSVDRADVFSLTELQGKPLSAATRMISPITPGKRLFSPQMKSTGIEYPSIRSTGPESIGSSMTRQIHSSGPRKKLSGDVFQISLQTEGEDNKRNLIQLRKIPQRITNFSSTTVGKGCQLRVEEVDEPRPTCEGRRRANQALEARLPSSHQPGYSVLKSEIPQLSTRSGKASLNQFKNTSDKLSPDNKLNFKKVLNKIRDMSEMSYERQKEQVKMRRKFRYPFLKHEDDAPKSMTLHLDHHHHKHQKKDQKDP